MAFLLLAVGSFLHVAVLPWLDLVVWTVNSATALLFAIILSIVMLNEKFIVKYDLSCFILMVIGGGTILTLSNHEEQIFSTDDVKRILTQPQSLVFYAVFIALWVTFFIVKNVIRSGGQSLTVMEPL